MFLDFKRSANDGDGTKLDRRDRENLAKAISGFGNSGGGVIVWGVDCRKTSNGADVACETRPIRDAKRFISWLQAAVSGCTIPAHGGVQHEAILINDSGDGYAVTLIPESDLAPHQELIKENYYIRAGSSFQRTPHSVISGLFGRKPSPNVFFSFGLKPPAFQPDSKNDELIIIPSLHPAIEGISVTIDLMVRNGGRGMAYDPFVELMDGSRPGINCRIHMIEMDTENWIIQRPHANVLILVGKREMRIVPGSYVLPIKLDIFLSPPFDKDLWIIGRCGSGNGPTHKFEMRHAAQALLEWYSPLCQYN